MTTTTTGRRLCAHADDDGRGMHYLEPGETCPDSVSVSGPVLSAGGASSTITTSPLAIKCPGWCIGEHNDSDLIAELMADDTISLTCDHSTTPWGPFTGLSETILTADGGATGARITVDTVLIAESMEDPAVMRQLATDALAAAEWLEANQ